MDKTDILRKGIENFNISPTDEMIERFSIYSSMLIEWNKKINLTTITDENDIIIKHFLDSISCIQSGIGLAKKRVIDVGTGAGFPGIPLKIVMPEIELTLLDSLKKRTVFLTELMENMNLKCEVIHGRAEDFGKESGYRESFDVALSRAVANMSVLVEYTLPFVKIGGNLLCQKGPAVHQEAEDAKNAIGVLGGKLKKIVPTNVYTSDFSHYIAIIQKIRTCPGKYPRKAGTVEKKPIK